MTRLAVFDCDGTLIDGHAGICDTMESAFAQIGRTPPPRSAVRRLVGRNLPQIARTLLPGESTHVHDALVDAYAHAFRDGRTTGAVSQPLFEGMDAVLDTLTQAGWTLAVATGMSRRGLDHCLAANGLDGRFVTLQTADDHPSKPHPRMLEAALAAAAAAPQHAVMIGDTHYDMEMARAAGVRAVGVAWGSHGAGELDAAGAEFVADTPAALAGYLLTGTLPAAAVRP